MRKKSHISLAKFIVENSEFEELRKHRFSFYLGSILPDIKPSFLYRKHEINGTLPDLQYKMCRVLDRIDEKKQHTRKDARKMGELSHYLADYFTFPHNKSYPGTLKDHCTYEEELKQTLRSYLKTQEAKENLKPKLTFQNTEALFAFVQKAHDEYIEEKDAKEQQVKDDINHIVEINHQALEGFLMLVNQRHMKRYASAK